MYNCNCFKTVRTTAIEAGNDTLTLTIPDMELRHGQHIRVCFAQTPPVISTAPAKVNVSVNAENIPVTQTRMEGACGALSLLYSDQLQSCCGHIKARQYLDLVFSADTKTFNYCGPCRCLPRANVAFPRFPAPAPTPAPVRSARAAEKEGAKK